MASSSKQPKTSSASTKPAPTPKKSWGLWLSALSIALLTAWAYSGALDNDFVDWDDYQYVIENNLVRGDQDIARSAQFVGSGRSYPNTTSPVTTSASDVWKRAVALNYHPLTVFSLRWQNNACANCSLGISARPFIRTNILLHILNSLLVLLLIYWMSKKNLGASTLVALIFALHPMHVESVAWVSERKDVLYAFFFLLGLLSYWRFLEGNSKRYWWAAFGCFVLACLSKAMAVVFPVAALLLYVWKTPQRGWDALRAAARPTAWRPLLPFLGLALFFGLLAVDIQSGGTGFGLLDRDAINVATSKMARYNAWERLQFAGYGFWQYIFKFFAPINLSTYYPYPEDAIFENSIGFKLAPLLMLLALGGVVVRFHKILFVGLWFYFITVALVLQFVSVGLVVMADRYTYLPYIGLAFALSMSIAHYVPAQRQSLVYGVLIAATLVFGYKTTQQVEVWQDSETLWSTVINQYQKADGSFPEAIAVPLSSRGNYYSKLGQNAATPQDQARYLNLAFRDFERAAALGIRNFKVYEGLGNVSGIRANGMLDQAGALQAKDPIRAQQLRQEANALLQQAIQHYDKALSLAPQKGDVYFNRAITHSILRNHAAAISDYTKVLELLPQQAAQAHLNRGLAYYALGRRQEAQADFQNALRYNPNDQQAKRYLNLLSR